MQDTSTMSQSDHEDSIREAHLRMVKNAQQYGREIKAVPVDPDIVGHDLAVSAVEASKKTMKIAAKRSFVVPALPWKKREKNGR